MTHKATNGGIHRIFSIILSCVGLIALILLGASIARLEFSPGKEVSWTKTGIQFPFGALFNLNWLTTFCVSLLLVMLPVSIVLLIFSPEARKYFRRNMKALLLWLGFFFVLQHIYRNTETTITFDNPEEVVAPPKLIQPPSSIGTEVGESELFAVADVAIWQAYLIGFILIVLVGLIIVYLWSKNQQETEGLEAIARKTLKDLNSGRKWEDAVIQCYAQMNNVVRRQRSLDRKKSITASEFALQLETAGLPSKPVHTLTNLFERARYGEQTSFNNEVDVALQCLTDIIYSLENQK
jgi:hypothetical protein